MPSTSDVRAGRAYVEIGANDTELQKDLNRIGGRFKAFGANLMQAGATLGIGGGAFTAPLLAAAKGYADAGAQMKLASIETGIPVEQLSRLKYAAEQSGVGFDNLLMALRRMQANLYAAENGNKAAIQTFEKLGLSISELKGLTPEDLFTRLSGKIAQTSNQTDKVATAIKLFGRSSAEIIPLIDQGSAAIKQMGDHAAETGQVWTDAAATGALALKRAMDDLTGSAKMVANAFGEALAPVLKKYAEDIAKLAPGIEKFAEIHKTLIQALFGTGLAMTAAGAGLTGLGIAFWSVGQTIQGVTSLFRAYGTATAALTYILWGDTEAVAANTKALGLNTVALGANAEVAATATAKWSGLLNALGTAGSWTRVGGLIGILVGELVYLGTHIDEVTQQWRQMIDFMSGKPLPVVQFQLGAIGDHSRQVLADAKIREPDRQGEFIKRTADDFAKTGDLEGAEARAMYAITEEQLAAAKAQRRNAEAIDPANLLGLFTGLSATLSGIGRSGLSAADLPGWKERLRQLSGTADQSDQGLDHPRDWYSGYPTQPFDFSMPAISYREVGTFNASAAAGLAAGGKSDTAQMIKHLASIDKKLDPKDRRGIGGNDLMFQ